MTILLLQGGNGKATGGAGEDVFVFEQEWRDSLGQHSVADFEIGVDLILFDFAGDSDPILDGVFNEWFAAHVTQSGGQYQDHRRLPGLWWS